MEWRKNAGYIITNAITIGESEIVLGVHETKPNMFVTWECANKNNYFWGHYFTSLLAAQKDFCERGIDKVRFYEQMKKNFHGNAKMLLHLFKNEITGKYDMQCTTRAIARTYPQNRCRLNIVDVDNVDYDYLCSVFGEIA